MNTVIFLIFIIGCIVVFWFYNLKAREKAEAAAKRLCHQLNVQFLDHSVSINKLTLLRLPSGRLTFQRFYQFEFSENGIQRNTGRVHMVGQRIKNIQADHQEGTTIEE